MVATASSDSLTTRLKREDCNRTKHDSVFSNWKATPISLSLSLSLSLYIYIYMCVFIGFDLPSVIRCESVLIISETFVSIPGSRFTRICLQILCLFIHTFMPITCSKLLLLLFFFFLFFKFFYFDSLGIQNFPPFI